MGHPTAAPHIRQLLADVGHPLLLRADYDG